MEGNEKFNARRKRKYVSEWLERCAPSDGEDIP
jgi:hypothetical protein